MLSIVARWERERLRTRLGRGASSALLAFPLLFLLPWGKLGYFDSAAHAGMVLAAIYAFTTAAMIGGDAGLMRPTMFWCFQKGLEPRDLAIAQWVVTGSFAAILNLVAAVGNAAGIALYGSLAMTDVAAQTFCALLLLFLVHGFMFLLASVGVKQRTEILLLLLLPSMLQTLLLGSHRSLLKAAHLLLLPVNDVFLAASTARHNEWPGAVGHSLHVTLFIVVCLTVGYWLQERWRPVPTRLAAE